MSDESDREVTRRRVLAGLAGVSTLALAGCTSHPSATFVGECDTFEVVEATNYVSSPTEAEIRLTKSFDEPVTYVAAVTDEYQYTAARVSTGVDTVKLEVPHDQSELLAIQGGRTEDGKVIGGTVAARCTLEVGDR